MSTFALVHGAWGSGWHWAGVPDALRAMGHEVVAPDLPCEDPEASFEDYAQVVIDALAGAGDDVVVVGYSIGGQTAPLVAARRAVRELVYVGALLVEPGASLLEQFGRGEQLLFDDYLAGIERAADRASSHWVDFDVYHRVSCQDLDEPGARERFARSRAQAVSPYAHPCPLSAQPEVPTRYVALADDRLVDNAHWLPVVRERLGIEPVGMPGDHSPMASRPDELAALLAG